MKTFVSQKHGEQEQEKHQLLPLCFGDFSVLGLRGCCGFSGCCSCFSLFSCFSDSTVDELVLPPSAVNLKEFKKKMMVNSRISHPLNKSN